MCWVEPVFKDKNVAVYRRLDWLRNAEVNTKTTFNMICMLQSINMIEFKLDLIIPVCFWTLGQKTHTQSQT